MPAGSAWRRYSALSRQTSCVSSARVVGVLAVPVDPDLGHAAQRDRRQHARLDALGRAADVLREHLGEHVLDARDAQALLGLELGAARDDASGSRASSRCRAPRPRARPSRSSAITASTAETPSGRSSRPTRALSMIASSMLKTISTLVGKYLKTVLGATSTVSAICVIVVAS